MDRNEPINSLLNVSYDREADILTFFFTKRPEPALQKQQMMSGCVIIGKQKGL